MLTDNRPIGKRNDFLKVASVPFMKFVRIVAPRLGMGVVCALLSACALPDIGDAKTAAELAASLEALPGVAPDHHRRLADGTFDSLSLPEQWDFVDEVEDLVRKRSYSNSDSASYSAGEVPEWLADHNRQIEAEIAESKAALRETMVMHMERLETLPPSSRERILASRREFVLIRLKMQDDFAAMHEATQSPLKWILAKIGMAEA